MRLSCVVLASALLVTGCSRGTTAAPAANVGPASEQHSASFAGAEQSPTGVWDESYLLPDERTIEVAALVGGGCDVTGRATAAVAENATVVTISLTIARPARTSPPGSSCPANAIEQRVTVPLTGPLGERIVRDGVAGTVLKRVLRGRG